VRARRVAQSRLEITTEHLSLLAPATDTRAAVTA
jgi:hypothetical protein